MVLSDGLKKERTKREIITKLIDLILTGLLIYIVIFAAGIVSFVLLVHSKDWTTTATNLIMAWSSIILMIVAYFSLNESRKLREEALKDRKMTFIRIQLDELYTPIISNIREIPGIVQLGEDQFLKIKSKTYLAESDMRRGLDSYITLRNQLDLVSDEKRSEHIVSIANSEQTILVLAKWDVEKLEVKLRDVVK